MGPLPCAFAKLFAFLTFDSNFKGQDEVIDDETIQNRHSQTKLH